MLYVALKELRYHGRTYPAGAPLPDGIGRWPELRTCQRRGYVSKDRRAVLASAPSADSADVTPKRKRR